MNCINHKLYINVGVRGLDPHEVLFYRQSYLPWTYSKIKMAPRENFEIPTLNLTGSCSASELTRNINVAVRGGFEPTKLGLGAEQSEEFNTFKWSIRYSVFISCINTLETRGHVCQFHHLTILRQICIGTNLSRCRRGDSNCPICQFTFDLRCISIHCYHFLKNTERTFSICILRRFIKITLVQRQWQDLNLQFQFRHNCVFPK